MLDPAGDPTIGSVDETLLAAVDLARAALLEITPADTIGEPLGHIVEGEHIISLLFDCTMTGYPGWHWTVSLSRIDGNSEPSVLETELMPGGNAVLAPDWVPWSERLADYSGAQDPSADEATANASDTEDEEEEDFEEDEGFDDDSGDDELDGIDFGEALAASELDEDQSDESESEADDGAPEPPAETARGEFGSKDEHEYEGH